MSAKNLIAPHLTDVVVLAKAASEITSGSADRKRTASRKEVEQGFFLNRIHMNS